MYELQEFTQDLPALLERAVELRNEALKNPEAVKESFILLNLEENESDYLVWFILTLMEACSVEEKMPGIICRILINNLFY